MAQFTNQATLSYNNTVVSSNIAVGEIVGSLTVSKIPLVDTYMQGDTVAYVINIVNSGASNINGLTLTDDLGVYPFGNTALVPLTYRDNSLRYFVNGVLQPAPAVNVGTALTVSGINIPAGGNAAIVYEATVNEYAPLQSGAEITNTVTVSGNGITPIEASATITAESGPILSITKSIDPVPVAENGTVTYTFVIENTGNEEAGADDNVVLTDVFDPVLSGITASLNGVTWAEGSEYTYDEATGLFTSVNGAITVPAAEYTQDPVSGIWQVSPGISTLVITGTI